MIYIDTAKKIRKAGFEWSPDIGDIFYSDQDGYEQVYKVGLDRGRVIKVNNWDWTDDLVRRTLTWLPSLERMLDIIEALGYEYKVVSEGSKHLHYVYIQKRMSGSDVWMTFTDIRVAEATAQALMTILKEEIYSDD